MQTTSINVYERRGTFYYDFRFNGQRVRKSTQCRSEAETRIEGTKALLQLEEQDLIATGEVRPDYLWSDAIVRYEKEKSRDGKSTLREDIRKFAWMEDANPGMGAMLLTKITRFWVDQNIRTKLIDRGLSKKTINNHLLLINHVLRLAAEEWESEGGLTWLAYAPKMKMEKIPKHQRNRIRYISRQEAQRLFNELPPHLEALARFAVATGLRASNVTGLRWEWIDLSKKMLVVPGDETKGKLAITVPLNDEAVDLIIAHRFKHPTHVFTFRGKPITQVSTKAWYAALKRAGIEDFKWHDLRHTFASWHIQADTPLKVLQELGGWETPDMVHKYAHLSASHLQEYANNTLVATAV